MLQVLGGKLYCTRTQSLEKRRQLSVGSLALFHPEMSYFSNRIRKFTCPLLPPSLPLFQLHKAIVRSSFGSASAHLCGCLLLLSSASDPSRPIYTACRTLSATSFLGQCCYLQDSSKVHPPPAGEHFQLLILGKSRIQRVPLRPTALCCYHYAQFTDGQRETEDHKSRTP